MFLRRPAGAVCHEPVVVRSAPVRQSVRDAHNPRLATEADAHRAIERVLAILTHVGGPQQIAVAIHGAREQADAAVDVDADRIHGAIAIVAARHRAVPAGKVATALADLGAVAVVAARSTDHVAHRIAMTTQDNRGEENNDESSHA